MRFCGSHPWPMSRKVLKTSIRKNPYICKITPTSPKAVWVKELNSTLAVSPILQHNHFIPVQREDVVAHEVPEYHQDLHEEISEVDLGVKVFNVVMVMTFGHLPQDAGHDSYIATLRRYYVQCSLSSLTWSFFSKILTNIGMISITNTYSVINSSNARKRIFSFINHWIKTMPTDALAP